MTAYKIKNFVVWKKWEFDFMETLVKHPKQIGYIIEYHKTNCNQLDIILYMNFFSNKFKTY